MMIIAPNTLLILAFICIALIVLSTLSKKAVLFVPAFIKRPLMNKSEQRLFSSISKDLPEDWAVMCQVSYGAFLGNKSFKRYMTVNSKRADFVIVSPDLAVAAVVEYQGSGHFGNTAQSRQRATKSDRIKRQALTEANVPLFEAPVKQYQQELHGFIKMVTGTQSVVLDNL